MKQDIKRSKWMVTLYCGSNNKVCGWVELRVVDCRAWLGHSSLFQELATDDARVADGIFKNTDHVIGQEVGNHKESSLIIGILGDLGQHRSRTEVGQWTFMEELNLECTSSKINLLIVTHVYLANVIRTMQEMIGTFTSGYLSSLTDQYGLNIVILFFASLGLTHQLGTVTQHHVAFLQHF